MWDVYACVSIHVCQWVCANGCVSIHVCQWMCVNGCVSTDVCQWMCVNKCMSMDECERMCANGCVSMDVRAIMERVKRSVCVQVRLNLDSCMQGQSVFLYGHVFVNECLCK